MDNAPKQLSWGALSKRDFVIHIAANQRGIQLVTELIDAYGLDVVQAYMAHIQANAEVAVRQVLKKFGKSALNR